MRIPAGLAHRIAAEQGGVVVDEIQKPALRAIPWARTLSWKPRWYQEQVPELLAKYRHMSVEAGCHRKGEMVLMYDGSTKAVEDIVVGDSLIGPDSFPRMVMELKRGKDTMYKIETINGQKMFVNGNHLLVLQRTCRYNRKISKKPRKDYRGENPFDIISVEEYLKKSDNYKYLWKMISAPFVDWGDRCCDVSVDPYFMGVLLGDGSVKTSIAVTTGDIEIKEEVFFQARKWGLSVNTVEGCGCNTYYLSATRWSKNPLRDALAKNGVGGTTCGDKRIPKEYLISSKENRLQLLAGLIDTDGCLSDGCFDYVSKSQGLCDDIAFLGRSLGFRVTTTSCFKKCQTGAIGLYFRCCISGDLSYVPVRLCRKKANERLQIKSVNRFGFSVEKVSDSEDYFGFVLDRDHQYLTDTFLVTHNTGLGKTRMISMVCRDFGLQAVVTSPFGSIVEQTYREFQQDLGKSRVGMYGCGRHDVDKDVVVATSQALMRLEKDDPRYQNFAKRGLMVFDESHMTAADTLHKLCFGMFEKVPYRLFLSGWQGRTDGLQTLLDAITGDVRLRMDVKQGVDQGFLARPMIRILDVESCMSTYKHDDVMKETQKVLYYNPIVIKKVANFANQMVDHGRPTFILVDEIDQYPELAKYLKHPSVFAHACSDVKRLEKLGLKKSNPLEVVDRFNQGEFPILVGTSAVGTGVDVRIPRAGVYFAGGMSEISVRQGMGRMTRLVEGKTDFVWLDIDIVDHPSMHRHAAKREEIYRRIYPDVLHVQF